MRCALVIGVLAACGRVDFDTVPDGAPLAPLSIANLWIHDPSTGMPLLDVTKGGSFDLSNHLDGIAVVAEVADPAGSVEFVRNGVPNLEAIAPYTSGGNAGGGFRPDQVLAIGDNTLAVTAYELPARGGAKGPTKTINLRLELAIDGIPTIVRAGIIKDNNTGFVELANNGRYSAATLPTDADVRIETSPANVGSVLIGGSALWNTGAEHYLPYTAMGHGMSFTPTPGTTYTLTARAFTEGYGKGSAGEPFTISFTIDP